jgi:2-oxoglutarate/2-oxoacid ferredoxin oxidoreductase subunit alpha
MSEIIREEKEAVTIRFAGDSGDGMQLTGTQFSTTSALMGNDISTFPDYPAEIRAPAGSLAGVSGFQINFSSGETLTPGDQPDALVAMNPAALKMNLPDLHSGGIVILNDASFGDKDLEQAGYDKDPEQAGLLTAYQVVRMDITKMTLEAVKKTGISRKAAIRCKNFFALGLVYHLYDRPLDTSIKWIQSKFGKLPDVAEANTLALKAGFNYAHNTEIFQSKYRVAKAEYKAGTYRSINGNTAVAFGLMTAAQKANSPLFYGSYPITPASDILQELARHQGFNVKTFQAEDEISAVGASIGAAFGGVISATGTSGPGLALKSEAIGLAVMVELPLVIINVQRAGPSTGLPTKTEQADLLQAVYGRHGESPVAVLAASTPADCFNMTVEAVRLAVKYMTPVILLTDGYLANGAEPWRIPDMEEIPDVVVKHAEPGDEPFLPYSRDPDTLARPWAVPGTEKLMHRIGGLEKEDGTGNVNYNPENHQKMVDYRESKIAGMVQDIPDVEVFGESSGETLVVSWGSTFGAIRSAISRLHTSGQEVSHCHLHYLNPFPGNLGSVLSGFKRILVPEMNLGQLTKLLRSQYLVDAVGINKVEGKPFKISEVEAAILEHVKTDAPSVGLKSA